MNDEDWRGEDPVTLAHIFRPVRQAPLPWLEGFEASKVTVYAIDTDDATKTLRATGLSGHVALSSVVAAADREPGEVEIDSTPSVAEPKALTQFIVEADGVLRVTNCREEADDVYSKSKRYGRILQVDGSVSEIRTKRS